MFSTRAESAVKRYFIPSSHLAVRIRARAVAESGSRETSTTGAHTESRITSSLHASGATGRNGSGASNRTGRFSSWVVGVEAVRVRNVGWVMVSARAAARATESPFSRASSMAFSFFSHAFWAAFSSTLGRRPEHFQGVGLPDKPVERVGLLVASRQQYGVLVDQCGVGQPVDQ